MKWERGLLIAALCVVKISVPNVWFLNFCSCSVYLYDWGRQEGVVVQEVHLSHPAESVCSDEKALCIQCLKLALKIAHSTS